MVAYRSRPKCHPLSSACHRSSTRIGPGRLRHEGHSPIVDLESTNMHPKAMMIIVTAYRQLSRDHCCHCPDGHRLLLGGQDNQLRAVIMRRSLIRQSLYSRRVTLRRKKTEAAHQISDDSESRSAAYVERIVGLIGTTIAPERRVTIAIFSVKSQFTQ
jgi:hypothetical protein